MYEWYEHYESVRRSDGSLWELGQGGVSTTYKAYDTHLKRSFRNATACAVRGDRRCGVQAVHVFGQRVEISLASSRLPPAQRREIFRQDTYSLRGSSRYIVFHVM